MTTAAVLVKNAYALAKIIDPNEEIEGYQAAEGLANLNEIIDQWSGLEIFIPTYKTISIATTAGTYSYVVTPPIIAMLEGHFIDSNNVQSPLTEIDLKRYNLINFVDGAMSPSRPGFVYLNNDAANMQIATPQTSVVLYPVPDTVYNVTLYVKSQLVNLDEQDVLTEIPPFYRRALRYELALELSQIYSSQLSDSFYLKYETLMKELKAATIKDWSVKNNNPLISYSRFRPWGIYVG